MPFALRSIVYFMQYYTGNIRFNLILLEPVIYNLFSFNRKEGGEAAGVSTGVLVLTVLTRIASELVMLSLFLNQKYQEQYPLQLKIRLSQLPFCCPLLRLPLRLLLSSSLIPLPPLNHQQDCSLSRPSRRMLIPHADLHPFLP